MIYFSAGRCGRRSIYFYHAGSRFDSGLGLLRYRRTFPANTHGKKCIYQIMTGSADTWSGDEGRLFKIK